MGKDLMINQVLSLTVHDEDYIWGASSGTLRRFTVGNPSTKRLTSNVALVDSRTISCNVPGVAVSKTKALKPHPEFYDPKIVQRTNDDVDDDPLWLLVTKYTYPGDL